MDDKQEKKTLRRYLEEVYLPEVLAANQRTGMSALFCRHAVERFEQFAGRDVLVDDIDYPLVNQFRTWLVDRGSDQQDARNLCHEVKEVVRYQKRIALEDRYIDRSKLPDLGDLLD